MDVVETTRAPQQGGNRFSIRAAARQRGQTNLVGTSNDEGNSGHDFATLVNFGRHRAACHATMTRSEASAKAEVAVVRRVRPGL